MCKKFWQHSRFSGLFQLQWIVSFCKKNSSNGRNNVCFEIKNSILPDKTEKISNIYFLPCGLHVLLNHGTYDKKTITDWKKLLVVSISPQILQLLICFMEFSNSWPMKSLHDKTKFTKLYCFFFITNSTLHSYLVLGIITSTWTTLLTFHPLKTEIFLLESIATDENGIFMGNSILLSM